MKQKFTLLAILLSVALFAVGQKPEVKNNETFWKSKVERYVKGLKQDNFEDRQNHLNQNNKNFSQNSNLKSSQEIKQRLDSVISQYWNDTTNQFLTYSKEENAYDANGNNIQSTFYLWDKVIEKWVHQDKYELAFNADNMLAQFAFFNWDEINSQWVADYKTDYTYDNNGGMSIRYEWDESNNQWVTSSKWETTYDDDGNYILHLYYYWDETTSQWVASTKYEYTYDENGYLTHESNYNWDKTTSQWVANWKQENTYDFDGNKTQSLFYYWDETTSQWNIFSKTDYTYDVNGNMTQLLRYNWEKDISQWVTIHKTDYIYDTNENLMKEINSSWDKTTSQWIASEKVECTYNNSYLLSDLLLSIFYYDPELRIYFNHMLIDLVNSRWDQTTNNWIIDYKGTFYYSEQDITSLSEVNGYELNVYPNPTIDYLNIEFSSTMNISYIEIINMQGMLVKHQEVATNQNTINVRDLSCGVYVIRVHTDKGIVIKKLIIQR